MRLDRHCTAPAGPTVAAAIPRPAGHQLETFDAALPFERAPEALRLLQGGGTIGKVVLEV